MPAQEPERSGGHTYLEQHPSLRLYALHRAAIVAAKAQTRLSPPALLARAGASIEYSCVRTQNNKTLC